VSAPLPPDDPARPPHHVQRVGAYGLVLSPEGDGRVLVVRLTERTPFPGAWSLPGGRVEVGEHPEQAVVRELFEETGLTGVVSDLLDVGSQVRDFYDTASTGRVYHAIRILYRVEVGEAGPLVVHDRDGSSDSPTWVEVGELRSLRLTPVVELALRHLPPPPAGPTPGE
jgi:8-oxo-dGTP diphosphatase